MKKHQICITLLISTLMKVKRIIKRNILKAIQIILNCNFNQKYFESTVPNSAELSNSTTAYPKAMSNVFDK